jgi:hypothetical protein
MIASCKILCPQPIDALQLRDPARIPPSTRVERKRLRDVVAGRARRGAASPVTNFFAGVAGRQLFPATHRLHMEAQREDEGAFAAIADERPVFL